MAEGKNNSVTVKERKFTLERLRKNCLKLFGVTSSTFDGAVCDLPKGEYSISEIKKHIENWKKKGAV